MSYRVIDLIISIEHRYPDEVGEERNRPYTLQQAKELMVRRATEAIETGRSINLAIIDTDHRVVQQVAVNIFPT